MEGIKVSILLRFRWHCRQSTGIGFHLISLGVGEDRPNPEHRNRSFSAFPFNKLLLATTKDKIYQNFKEVLP